ncbi:hypothetical protein ACQE3D_04065 [Methylomonas sp. MS20]|uniref:hypothetical protein n=1 Tax=unclassified Methylomonas TaxID=2608980 RepID=UPI0028A50FFB|nr:hypothetical protein [Methylomonas sp. MV1]MDT4329945.1 hypothetical protein [Methylomonas sp. MV1]
MTGNGQTVAIESDRAIVRNGSIETDLKSPAINSTLSDLSNAVMPAGMGASSARMASFDPSAGSGFRLSLPK